jgi:hypothetical protein
LIPFLWVMRLQEILKAAWQEGTYHSLAEVGKLCCKRQLFFLHCHNYIYLNFYLWTFVQNKNYCVKQCISKETSPSVFIPFCLYTMFVDNTSLAVLKGRMAGESLKAQQRWEYTLIVMFLLLSLI